MSDDELKPNDTDDHSPIDIFAESNVEKEEPKKEDSYKVYSMYDDITDALLKEHQDIFTLGVSSFPFDEETIMGLDASLTRKLKDVEKGSKEANAIETLSRTISAVLFTTFKDEDYRSVFEKEDTDFRQCITGDLGKTIRMANMSVNLGENTETIEGTQGMSFISGFMGTGKKTSAPLWSSGLVLEFKSFSEKRLLDLNLELAKKRIDLGSDTRGSSFSGDDVYVVMTIVDFILEHVTNCNLKNWTVAKLNKLILVPDIITLLANALETIYPTGYPVYHVCKNVIKDKCSYELDAKINDRGDYEPDSLLHFHKTVWVDNNRLTSSAITHMSTANQSVTEKDILRYQKDLYGEGSRKKNTVWESGGKSVSVSFRVPNLVEYRKECNKWISSISAMVDKSLRVNSELTGEDKVNAKLVNLTKYSERLDALKHLSWVSHFIISQDTEGYKDKTVNSKDAIEQALSIFIQTKGFSKRFKELQQTYKEDVQISFTGLSNYACPQCGDGQVDDSSSHPSLIPMNMVGYFFITMEWREAFRRLSQ